MSTRRKAKESRTLRLLLDMTPRTPWWISASLSFCLAVTNGFVWNRRWTFRARGHGSLRAQYSRFVTINLIGLVLNLGLTKLFLILFTGQLRHLGGNPKAIKVLIASLAAVPCVTLWNFAGSKYWTFRPMAAARAGDGNRSGEGEPVVGDAEPGRRRR